MIEYYIYGQAVKEYYHMGKKLYSDPFYWCNWYDLEYYLGNNNTEDEIFGRILIEQKFLQDIGRCYEDNKNQKILISLPEKWFWRDYKFVEYKEFKIITTDLELRDGETIRIENKDYKVKYKYNDDKKQNELYIDKVIEIIVDEEESKYAKMVCNGVVKKIIKHNKEIEKEEIEESKETTDKPQITNKKENTSNMMKKEGVFKSFVGKLKKLF